MFKIKILQIFQSTYCIMCLKINEAMREQICKKFAGKELTGMLILLCTRFFHRSGAICSIGVGGGGC